MPKTKKKRILSTVEEVLEVLGGPHGVSKITGRSISACANDRGYGKFPAATYIVMNEALDDLGREADPLLWGMILPENVQRKKTA